MKLCILTLVLVSFIIQFASGVEIEDLIESKQAEDKEIMRLSLEDCVKLAIEQNRQFLREEEELVLEQLSYELTRHNYGPLLNGTLKSERNDKGSTTQRAELSATQRLFTGGDLGFSASSSGTNGSGDEGNSYESVLSLDYIQPLLKDAGKLIYREELTSAEREVRYARRSLTLFKQEFLITIVRQYYRLLQRELTIANQQQKVDNAKLLFERSKAQRDRGKASPIDVYRAELTLRRAENELLDAMDLYKLSLDDFKIDLGLPAEFEVALERREIKYVPIEVDLEESVGLALVNRLEMKTVQDQVEDSKRQLDIARNRLRSRLDFGVSIQSGTGPAERFKDQDFGDAEWIVGIEYEVPLDRKAERTDYRTQLISYLRTVRSREVKRDELVAEVRSVVTDLRTAEAVLKITERSIEISEKQLERARSDYDRGTITNRDVVDALSDLTDARNGYEEAIVDYIIARLELLRVTGVMEFENWKELIE